MSIHYCLIILSLKLKLTNGGSNKIYLLLDQSTRTNRLNTPQHFKLIQYSRPQIKIDTFCDSSQN